MTGGAPCVVVAAGALGAAKSRFAPLFGEAERAALALAMLGDVLEAVRAAHDGPLLVVTPDARCAEAARAAGAAPLADAGTGYNAAVRLALASDAARAAGAAAIVPADQARARPSEMREALGALREAEVVLAPSLDGGTGLLGLRPPDAIAPAFGPDSAAAHERAARRAGRSLALLRLASLALDIDTPADLDAPGPPPGPRTAAFAAARAAQRGGARNEGGAGAGGGATLRRAAGGER